MLEFFGVSFPFLLPILIGVGIVLGVAGRALTRRLKKKGRVVEYRTRGGHTAKGRVVGRSGANLRVVNGAGVEVLVHPKGMYRVA